MSPGIMPPSETGDTTVTAGRPAGHEAIASSSPGHGQAGAVGGGTIFRFVVSIVGQLRTR
jgi:hypothetical protein